MLLVFVLPQCTKMVPAHSVVSLLTDCMVVCDIHYFGLITADIHQLSSIIMDNTYVSHTYKQTISLPMGSSHLGLLAITYMNHLKCLELNICYSCTFFTRYVDDILILTSSCEEVDRIFTAFDNMDMNI